MNFGWPNAEIGRKMANGQLLFPTLQYINYGCNYFIAVLCVHVTVLYLIYINSMVHKPVFIPAKDSNTHAYAHLWSPNDGDRNQQNN